MSHVDMNLFDMPTPGDGSPTKMQNANEGMPSTSLNHSTQEISKESEIFWHKKVLFWTLVGQLLLGGSFGFFMLRQAVMLNRQKIEQKRVIMNFNSNELPRIELLLNSLRMFGSTNPDYAQILGRHVLFMPVSQTGAPSKVVPVRPQATSPIVTAPAVPSKGQ